MYARLLCAKIRGSLIACPPSFRWCLTSVILLGVAGIWLFWWYIPAIAHLQQLRITAQQYPSWSSMLKQQQKTLQTIQNAVEPPGTQTTSCSEQHLLEFIVSQAQDHHLVLHECSISHQNTAAKKGLCTWELEGSIDQIADCFQHILASRLPLTVERISLTWLTPERIQIRGQLSLISY